jgi:hypothetical protein
MGRNGRARQHQEPWLPTRKTLGAFCLTTEIKNVNFAEGDIFYFCGQKSIGESERKSFSFHFNFINYVLIKLARLENRGY